MNNVERREQIQVELANLIGADSPEGTHAPHEGTHLHTRAGEVLDFLTGAGLLYWGGLPVMQPPPGGAGPLKALRIAAEYWWRLPNSPQVPEGTPEPYWHAFHVLVVQGVVASPARRMVDVQCLTPEQRAATLEAARAVVRELEAGEVERSGDGLLGEEQP